MVTIDKKEIFQGILSRLENEQQKILNKLDELDEHEEEDQKTLNNIISLLNKYFKIEDLKEKMEKKLGTENLYN